MLLHKSVKCIFVKMCFAENFNCTMHLLQDVGLGELTLAVLLHEDTRTVAYSVKILHASSHAGCPVGWTGHKNCRKINGPCCRA